MGRTKHKDVRYEEYKNLIWDQALRFSIKFGVEVTDLVSYASELFLSAKKEWNPKRGCFSTFFYIKLRSKFSNYCRKESKIPPMVSWTDDNGEQLFEELICPEAGPEQQICFREEINLLSDEAKEIIRIFLTQPKEIVQYCRGNPTPKNIRGAIKDYLRTLNRTKPYRWTLDRIYRTYHELEDFIRREM